MFCEKCGKELLDGSKFCDGCGAEIENNKVEEKVNAKKRPYDSNAFKSEAKYSLANNWFMAFLFMLIGKKYHFRFLARWERLCILLLIPLKRLRI